MVQKTYKLKRNVKRLLITSLCLIVMVTFGTVLAYLTDKSNVVVNEFQPVQVSCEVIENGTDGSGDFDGLEKTNVKVQNTSETDVYVRATIIVNWISEDNKNILAEAPIENEDYIIEYTENSGWVRDDNNFWYYSEPLEIDEITKSLIDSCSPVEGETPNGYQLSVEVVASAIQSSPIKAVNESWKNISVDEDTGILSVK